MAGGMAWQQQAGAASAGSNIEKTGEKAKKYRNRHRKHGVISMAQRNNQASENL